MNLDVFQLSILWHNEVVFPRPCPPKTAWLVTHIQLYIFTCDIQMSDTSYRYKILQQISRPFAHHSSFCISCLFISSHEWFSHHLHRSSCFTCSSSSAHDIWTVFKWTFCPCCHMNHNHYNINLLYLCYFFFFHLPCMHSSHHKFTLTQW